MKLRGLVGVVGVVTAAGCAAGPRGAPAAASVGAGAAPAAGVNEDAGPALFARTRQPDSDDIAAPFVRARSRRFTWEFAFTASTPPRVTSEFVVPVGGFVHITTETADDPMVLGLPGLSASDCAAAGTREGLWVQAVRAGNGHTRCVGESCRRLPAGAYTNPVRVVTREEYERSLRADREPPPGQTREQWGAALFARFACNACHSVDGAQGVGPSLRGVWGSTVTLASGAAVRVQGEAGSAYLLRSIEEPGAEIVGGYPPVMPSFRGPTTPEQRAALVAYVRSLGAP